jgi:putative selenate reductase FAD-binding subunit
VALGAEGQRIALDGVLPQAARLRKIEPQALNGEALEQAVAHAVAPCADLRGSVDYKRYIAGVAVADLLAACLQMKEGK